MECLQGMSNKKICILNKCIYSLVQAVMQCVKKAIEILKILGFLRGNVHSCLYVKKSAKGIVYIALYVDDNLMICDMAAIDDAIKALKNKGWCLKLQRAAGLLVLQNKVY